jgi:hypothetical protein
MKRNAGAFKKLECPSIFQNTPNNGGKNTLGNFVTSKETLK